MRWDESYFDLRLRIYLANISMDALCSLWYVVFNLGRALGVLGTWSIRFGYNFVSLGARHQLFSRRLMTSLQIKILQNPESNLSMARKCGAWNWINNEQINYLRQIHQFHFVTCEVWVGFGSSRNQIWINLSKSSPRMFNWIQLHSKLGLEFIMCCVLLSNSFRPECCKGNTFISDIFFFLMAFVIQLWSCHIRTRHW